MRAPALVLLAVACGHAPTSGPRATRPSPTVTAYPAMRWVPARATYVVTARTAAGLVAVGRELTLVAGLLDDFDLAQAQDELRREVGFDPLSIDGLREIGVDPDGGVAVFSEGLSPILAVQLADPQRTIGLIDERRGEHPVEVSREAGVDVYTYAGDRDVHLHWAIADRWLFVHLEFTAEHEADLAWYRALRAGGDFDLAAVMPGGDPAPIAGIVQVPALRTHLARIGAPRACLDAFAPVGRALVTAGVIGKDATGTITLEVASPGPAAAAIAPPPGWAAAREGAAIQAEWTADLERAAPILAACDARDSRDLAELGIRAGGGFLHQLDVDDLDGKGAAWYVARDTRLLDDALDRIPGLRFGSHKRTVGGVAVVDVSMPMIPSFSYARTATSATIAIGGGLIDAIVAGKPGPQVSLVHVELHPWGLSDDVWDAILRYAAHMDSDTNRKQAIRRAHRWDVGRIDVEARPGALVLTARGHVHT